MLRVREKDHRPPWLGDKLVTAFADAPNDKVWIASLGGGLVQFDGVTGEVTDVDAIAGRRNAVDRQLQRMITAARSTR